MKYLRLALFASVATIGIARAQDEERRAPPTEIPDFSNLDEYIYEPKSTLAWGFRRLSGAKMSFSGGGQISGLGDAKDVSTPNIERTYSDGSVRPDARTTPRLDGSGNPAIDPLNGATISDPIAPDGRTNSWTYFDADQVHPDGYIMFHNYTAEVVDTGVRQKTSEANSGVELAMIRDMGTLFGTKLQWKITGGVALNDISGQTSDSVLARINTLTDYYSLLGANAPEAPYSAPSSSSEIVRDASGNPVLNEAGSPISVAVDTSTLIGDRPAGRELSTSTSTTAVTNRWKVKGSYFTFRLGPTLVYPITTKLRASLSIGAAVAYAGTNYTVTELFDPEFGGQIEESATESMYKLLPGYYADATVQYDLTERAGFYAGAVYQSTGSYNQNVSGSNSTYTTKVDLSNQNGLRAGMTVRF